MFITIHLLILYFIECYHFYNDYIHVLMNKKTANIIRIEARKKQQEQTENSRRLKNICIDTFHRAYFSRYVLPDVSNKKQKYGNLLNRCLISRIILFLVKYVRYVETIVMEMRFTTIKSIQKILIVNVSKMDISFIKHDLQ